MKTKSIKILSGGLIGLFSCGLAFAGTTSSATTSPTQETQLLTSLIALQGENLGADQLQAQALTAVRSYESSITDAGTPAQSDRLTQAVEKLNLMTPEQARAFQDQVSASVSQEHEANPAFNGDQVAALATYHVLEQGLPGAQFSKCASFGIGGGAVLAAAIMANVYASTLTHTTTSSSYTGYESGTTTTTTNSNGSTTTTTSVTDNSGDTTTTVTTTNETEKKLLMGAAGISYGIAGALFIYTIVEATSYTGC